MVRGGLNNAFWSSGEFYSLGCAFNWAIAVILFRKSGERVTPVALNLFKNGVGLVLFLISLPILGIALFPQDQTTGAWVTLVLSGALGIGVADTLFFAGLNRLGAANTALVDCMYSPFVVLSAFVYLHEPVGPTLLISMALMVGAILLGTWEPRLPKTSAERKSIAVGIALGVAAQLLMAVGIVIAKPVLETSNAWWATTVRLIGGGALLAVHGMTRRHRAHVLRCLRPSADWRFTIPAAVAGAYVALILWILGMKYTYASIAGVLNQTSTIFILILAWLLLKERITVRKLLAIGMACVGAICVAVPSPVLVRTARSLLHI
jgi:drug/metabolite transporter (DMT)-like permease